MMVWQIGGAALAVAGLAALYQSWSRKARSWPLVLLGWTLISGAVLSWGQTSGVDKGPALGVIVVMLTALAGLAGLGLVAVRNPVKHRRQIQPRSNPAIAKESLWRAGFSVTTQVLVIIIIGLLTSLAICTAIFMANRSAGMEHTANLTLTMFAFPVIWAALATFVGYAQSARLKAVTLAAFATASAAVIAVMIEGN